MDDWSLKIELKRVTQHRSQIVPILTYLEGGGLSKIQIDFLGNERIVWHWMMRSPWILASILSQKYPDGRAVGKYANTEIWNTESQMPNVMLQKLKYRKVTYWKLKYHMVLTFLCLLSWVSSKDLIWNMICGSHGWATRLFAQVGYSWSWSY